MVSKDLAKSKCFRTAVYNSKHIYAESILKFCLCVEKVLDIFYISILF